ncbi:uncharacterized protein BDR25DRAFT_230630 [Lindgomyces ingoldianus]|uniref:Uncharacterized protein n=1 Tax=Lindgomyces ingoldianus TaxID=673940 RepID=A0ACB6QP50_9PLEO|nr:uncharacterized protein BDR25DRAFT_230630 [Lindgomyces ingoldianus]KAF2468686.1 hypothetical protein BDR25DRAFT_230630 [Lindgomyces ingoldianus]
MFSTIWSLLGWKEELPPSPPTVTITGVRIPSDGTPAHLLSLTTISDSKATDGFLFHVPDLRRYWNSEQAWRQTQYHTLQHQHLSCVGAYYVFYSFDLDSLPRNMFVPAWVSEISDGVHFSFHGDVFLVKMSPHEYGENRWAVYEDITPLFLDLLVKGPISR